MSELQQLHVQFGPDQTIFFFIILLECAMNTINPI